MNLRSTLRTAFSALLRNRARSLLTMLGVVIGVGAVIITVAIGASFQFYSCGVVNPTQTIITKWMKNVREHGGE